MHGSPIWTGTKVLLALVGVLVVVSWRPAPDGSRNVEARAWLVYITRAQLSENYSCADVPRQLGRLRVWPGGTLPSGGATANDPAWSPDGKRVAFSSGGLVCTNGDGIGQDEAQIRVVDSSGRNLRSITRRDPVAQSRIDRSPAWSPDGRRIAFVRTDWSSGTGGIYVVRTDGSGLRRLSRQQALALDWSPDGRSIAFIPGERLVFGYSAANRVAVLDVQSRRMRTFTAREPDDLSWSPDGRRIAVTGNRAISIVDARGTTLRTIRIAGSRQVWLNGVTWAPNGRRIAYSDGRTIFTVGVDGGAPQRIVDGLAPDWRG